MSSGFLRSKVILGWKSGRKCRRSPCLTWIGSVTTSPEGQPTPDMASTPVYRRTFSSTSKALLSSDRIATTTTKPKGYGKQPGHLPRTKDPLLSAPNAQYYALPNGTQFIVRSPSSKLPPVFGFPPAEEESSSSSTSTSSLSTSSSSSIDGQPSTSILSKGNPFKSLYTTDSFFANYRNSPEVERLKTELYIPPLRSSSFPDVGANKATGGENSPSSSSSSMSTPPLNPSKVTKPRKQFKRSAITPELQLQLRQQFLKEPTLATIQEMSDMTLIPKPLLEEMVVFSHFSSIEEVEAVGKYRRERMKQQEEEQNRRNMRTVGKQGKLLPITWRKEIVREERARRRLLW